MLPHLDFRFYSYQKNHISLLTFFDIFKVLKENTLFGALKERFESRKIQLSRRPTFLQTRQECVKRKMICTRTFFLPTVIIGKIFD